MSDYGAKLLGWMSQNGIQDDSLRNYFMSGESDKTKEAMANMYRAFMNKKDEPAGHHNSEDEHMHLEPYKNADGSFGYIDRRKGQIIVSVTRHANGLFSYSGPRKYLEILGGRGSLSGIVERMSDGDYFNKS